MGIQEQINDAFEGSDVAGADRVEQARDGLQSGDVDGSLGARETSVLRAQENQAAEQGTLAELAKERLGDPTATMSGGSATATSPNTLESNVVDVDAEDVGEAGREVQASESGEFNDGTTVRSSEGFLEKARRFASNPRIMFQGETYQNPAYEPPTSTSADESDGTSAQTNSDDASSTVMPPGVSMPDAGSLPVSPVQLVVGVVALVAGVVALGGAD